MVYAMLSRLLRKSLTHTVMLQQLSDQQDDIENMNRRNNIQIRGLPESVEHKVLKWQ